MTRVVGLVLAVAVSAVVFMMMGMNYKTVVPAGAHSSDGVSSEKIIENMKVPVSRGITGNIVGFITGTETKKESYEEVNLKTEPYGYIMVTEWAGLPSGQKVDRLSIKSIWHTDVGEGAGNIYVGYSLGNGVFYEKGPFKESAQDVETVIDIYGVSAEELKGLKVRWRGQDLDFMTPAFGYVRFEMEVY